MKSIRRAGTVVAALALAIPLAACSGGQSVAEACDIANVAVNEANAETQSLLQGLGQGEGDLSSMFDPVNAALEKAQSQVKNDEVSDALKRVADEFSALSVDLQDFKMPDMSELDMTDPEALSKLQEMQSQTEAFTSKLQSRSDSLMEAGNAWQELCPAR